MNRLRSNLRRLAAVMGAVVATVTGGSTPLQAAASARPCPNANLKELNENRYVRIYRFVAGRHRGETETCVKATGARTLLDPVASDDVLTPPRPALNGHAAAFVLDRSLPEGESLSLWVFDARGRFLPTGESYRAIEVSRWFPQRIVVRPNGAVAWSVGDTAVDRIYRQASSEEKPRLLARGSGVDPASLQLDGARVVWVDRGRRRSASLK